MKTIVHVCKRAPETKDMEHNFRGHASRSGPERFCGENKVTDVCGNTCGAGFVIKSPGFEREMISALSGNNFNHRGRNLRQIILSSEDLPDTSEKEFKVALLKLMGGALCFLNGTRQTA